MSFIERYSHLLEEDGAAGEVKPERANPLAQALPIAPAIARPEEAILAPKSEEEDSIEQYMAKLLQRVRGDSDGGKAAREQPIADAVECADCETCRSIEPNNRRRWP